MSKKSPISFCITFFFLLTLNSSAQAPAWQWAKSAGTAADFDKATSVATDPSGNCYVTGYFQSLTITFGSFVLTNANSSGNSSDLFLVKYTSAGSVIWAQSVGNGNSEDDANSVATDVFGNCYMTGFFTGPAITFGSTTLTSFGGSDIFIVKYDPAGNVLWAKKAGGSDGDMPSSIAVDGAGGCYVSGTTGSFSLLFGSINLINGNGYLVPFMAKYDASGNAAWAKIAKGNNNNAEAYDGAADASGNNYITGYFFGTQIVFGADTLLNADVTGSSCAIFIVKYDVLGNQLWSKTAVNSQNDISYSVAADASGNCYITGSFYGPTIIFDSDTLHNAGSINLFLVKYDPAGNIVWTKREGGGFDDAGSAVEVDVSGNIYVEGYFRSPALNFGFITLTNAGPSTFSLDLFIAKYNSSGNLLWVKNAGGTDTDASGALAVDALGNSYVAGFFYSPTISFGPTTLTNSDNSNSTYDMFVAKLDNTGTTVAGINSTQGLENNISVYPNPSSGVFSLELNRDDFSKTQIEVYDAMEKTIFKSEILNQKSEIDLSGNAQGIYFYRVSDATGIIGTGKIIVQ